MTGRLISDASDPITLDHEAEPAPEVRDPRDLELEELRKALAARDDFIAVVAHELRNPMGAISLQTESLLLLVQRSGDAIPPGIALRLEALRRQTAAFVRRSTMLLDVSRATAGQVPMSPEPSDLVTVARGVFDGFHAELELRKISAAWSAPVAIEGTWDRVRLEQIIFNLVSNAIKYGDGKPIRLSLRATQGHALISVRDRGIGVAEADRERIFERFARGSERTHEVGFGVGLWLVRTIVDAMGGKISVRSRLGEGSRFTAVLPRISKG